MGPFVNDHESRLRLSVALAMEQYPSTRSLTTWGVHEIAVGI